MSTRDRAGAAYRDRGRAREAPRGLTFHHRRFMLVLVFAALAWAGTTLFITFPREVRVSCAPDGTRALDCTSWASAPFGGEVVRHAEVPADPPALLPLELGAKEPEPSFRDLEVELRSERARQGQSVQLVARSGGGFERELSAPYPGRADPSRAERLKAFESSLRRGEPATFAYRSGFGGLGITTVLSLSVLWVVWMLSGRSRVVYHPDTDSVQVESRARWLAKAKRHTLSRRDIAEIFRLEKSLGNGEQTLHVPAFRLESGEVVELGDDGLTTPDRAEHFVARLQRLLDRAPAELEPP